LDKGANRHRLTFMPIADGSARAAIKAGFLYWFLVFAAGFALGTLRVLVLMPAFGEVPATLLELPLMLLASWLACDFVLRMIRLGHDRHPRLIMGAVAFALLMLAEALLSNLIFGRSLAGHITLYREPIKALGLMAQILFGLMPLVRHHQKS
jgi:hypothetical protein